MIAANNGEAIVTTNAGGSWKGYSTGAAALSTVACSSASHCWAAENHGGVLATSNGGTSWSAQSTGNTQALLDISCLPHASSTACWAVGNMGTVITTSEGGSSWSTQTAGTAQLNAVSFVNGGRGWAVGNSGAIYALVAPCSAGGLALAAPGSVTFPTITLSGANQTDSTSAVLTPEDETDNLFGWNISATSTTFATLEGKKLSTSATTLTNATAAAAANNCSLPTNSVSYPITLPAGATAPTAVKLFNAAAGTGSGPASVTLGATLAIPPSASSGSYSSTWTLTIASGP